MKSVRARLSEERVYCRVSLKGMVARHGLTGRWRHCALLAAIGIFLALGRTTAPAFVDGHGLPNTDVRIDDPASRQTCALAVASVETAARNQAVTELQRQVPGARVSIHPSLGTPSFIRSTSRFLTAKADPGDWIKILKEYVAERPSLFGVDARLLDACRVSRDFVTRHNGVRSITLQQQINGADLIGAELRANFSSDGELINVSSALLPIPGKIREDGFGALLTAEQAIQAASKSVGMAVKEPLVRLEGAGAPGQTRFSQGATYAAPPAAHRAYFPLTRTTARPVWVTLIPEIGPGNVYEVVVDAGDSRVLSRRNQTQYASATYNVFTSDSPSPLSPGLATPNGYQPPLVSRTLVTTEAIYLTGSPNGWVDTTYNETRGNNVDAHLDLNADNSPDLPRPAGGPSRVFNFPMNLPGDAPSAYQDAAVTQLFYLNNFVHDRYYQLGFDEASGNFQNDNFGRGGLGNDAVQADAQDGSGTNNANFNTPPDGSPGRMQMFIFDYPTPDRDGDLDAEIVIHEYTHGLSNRLCSLSNIQCGGLGEGWSDFYALSLLAEPGDDPRANYASGAYACYLLGGLTDNYYFGIRRFPYSTNQTINPETFADIDPNQISFPPAIPRSPIIGNQADEVHNVGEVWCVILWSCRAYMIEKHGFAGNEIMLQLVTDAMKLSPADPDFIQARDAILQADLADNGGANLLPLWTGFAERGLGLSATSPGSYTCYGVVEAFDTPSFDDLAVAPNAAFASSGFQGGPFSPSSKVYTLQNNGAAPLDWTAAESLAWADLSATSGTLAPGSTATVTVSINSAANALGWSLTPYSGNILFTNTTSAFSQTRAVQLTVNQPPADIAISPNSFLFRQAPDEIKSTTLTIQNTAPPGNQDLNFTIQTSALGGGSGFAFSGKGEPVETVALLPAVAGAIQGQAGCYLPKGYASPGCPASRFVARATNSSSASAKVLLLASGANPSVLRTALQAFPDIDSVDYFDASLAVPTLGNLTPYDVVVVMSNSGFANASATGDALADYVDADGLVVEAVAAFATGGGYELSGRFVTGDYEPFNHGGAQFMPHSLGAFDGSHPIMDGVTAVTDGLPAAVTMKSSADWVADWNNGTPLVATKDGKVVGINIYAFDDGDWTGDVPQLFHNAIIWLASGGGASWLSVAPGAGVVAPGSDFTVQVIADSTGLADGQYEGLITINSNDPDESPTTAPVTLFVYSGPLVITHTPLGNTTNLGPYDVDALVTATVAGGVARADVLWSVNGGASFTTASMAHLTGDLYRGVIPAQSIGTVVSYYLEAEDTASTIATRPTGAPASVYEFQVQGVPNLEVTPANMVFVVPADQTRDKVLRLSNTGTWPTDWSLEEKPGAAPFRVTAALPAVRAGNSPGNGSSLTDNKPAPGRQAMEYVAHIAADALAQPADVLMAYSDNISGPPTVLQTALLAFPGVNSVDLLNIQPAAPALSALTPYDVVMVMTNTGLADSAGVGDVLADYIDAGGKVIVMCGAIVTGGSWEVSGRFVTDGYDPFIHGPVNFAAVSLGTYDPDHPIMEGITVIGDGLTGLVGLQPTAVWVADWNNGSPLAATQDASVVGINAFPMNGAYWSGDLPLLCYNSIVWLVQSGGVPWLSEDQTTGTLNPGQFIDVIITADATGLPEGYTDNAMLRITGESDTSATVDVALIVQSDELTVTPSGDFATSGPAGGPFPAVAGAYALHNTSTTAALSWQTAESLTWIDLSPASGVLAPGQFTTVTVGVNASANSLPEGVTTGVIAFRNAGTGFEYRRGVSLEARGIESFLFDTVTSPQAAQVPFGVTLTAVDMAGMKVSAFGGSVLLSAWVGQGFEDDMEGGAIGWTASGLWHLVDAGSPYPESHSGTHSWWYGQDSTGTYDTGAPNSGELISPSFTVSSGSLLTFWSWEQTESNGTMWDTRTVWITTDSAVTWTMLYQSSDNSSAWYQAGPVDLSAYAGQTAQIKFVFDTVDSIQNAFRGWYVDGVKIGGFSPVSMTYSPGAFVSGVWTPQIAIDLPTTGVFLRADGPTSKTGQSNTFDVLTIPPGLPSGPNPAHGSSGVPVAAALDWDDCGFTLTYDLYLWKATQPKPGVPNYTGLSVSLFDPPGALDVGTTYSWQVIARNPWGQTPGQEWAFSTVLPASNAPDWMRY